MAQHRIGAHRKRIDTLDANILTLLSSRAKEVKAIGACKAGAGAPIRVPEREFQLLARLRRLNKGPYPHAAIEAIYREILSASVALEAPLSVAFLGPETSFSHQATLSLFGHSLASKPQVELTQVFEAVEKGEATYGVVPIENSVEGVVHRSLDLLVVHPLRICAEIYLPVSHHLLTRAKSLSFIRTIYSHPQAWGQCGRFLASHGFDPHHFEETASTAAAAALAAKDPRAAAIASKEAAARYKLPILRANIQDSESNETRFVVLGRDAPGRTGQDKTTILIEVKDEIGVLARILNHLATAKINLNKIESRPSRIQGWRYFFYIDMEGHIEDRHVARALAKVEKHCLQFRSLGSYPSGRQN